jgi:hypothetical protein
MVAEEDELFDMDAAGAMLLEGLGDFMVSGTHIPHIPVRFPTWLVSVLWAQL